jgi:23S rRNA-intervening sequence protein
MERRKPVRSFEDLMIWQMGIELAKRVYLLTASGLLSKDFGLRNQIRRASVSVPTNIAEGFERSSRGEVRSLLRVAVEVGYLESETYESLREDALKLSAYLSNHAKAIRRSDH